MPSLFLLETGTCHMKILYLQVFDSITQRFIMIPQLNQLSVHIVNCDIFVLTLLQLVLCRLTSVIFVVAAKLTEFCIRLDYLLLDGFGHHAIQLI